MNKTVKKAMEIDQFNNQIPVLEIGDIVTLGEVWDGEGEVPKYGCSYLLTDSGEDGMSNEDISINYEFEVLAKSDEVLNTTIKITDIDLI